MAKRETRHAKNREDILSILDNMIEENGAHMSLTMISVNQKTGLGLYSTSLSTAFLYSLICRLPRNVDNPEGIQRTLNTAALTQIKELHDKRNCRTPNGISLTLKRNSPFINCAARGKELILTIDLKAYREHISALPVDDNGYLLNPEENMLGFLIDGHHRTEGSYLADDMDYEFVAGVYLNCDRREIGTDFVVINANQSKPSAVHVSSVMDMSGSFNDDEKNAYELVKLLNERSPLFRDRIRMFDGSRPKNAPRLFINNNKIMSLLEKWIDNNPQSAYICNSTKERYKLLCSYFEAWHDCYEEAWDNAEYVLTKAMGITLMFSVYESLASIVRDRIGNRRPVKEDFIRAIKDTLFTSEDEPIVIELTEENGAALDWKGTSFGSMSSGKGINAISKELRNVLAKYRGRQSVNNMC